MGSLNNKMHHFIKHIRMIDIQTKYRILSISIALVHFLFTIGFGIGHIMPLFWYNFAITLFYLYQGIVSIRKEQYIFMYIRTIIEILFYAVGASLLLGWDWGFAMYTMSLIPASFYLTYTLSHLKRHLLLPIGTSMMVAICFILVRALCQMSEPLYQGYYPEILQICFYYFNIIIALAMLVIFSSLFALEIDYMQKQLEKENHTLENLANYDPLTRLLNRRSMNKNLHTVQQEALQQGKPFCLLLVDIDNFKKVNDTHGHDCGDEVLVTISDLIMSDVREGDFVCRWGGEEILVLLRADLDISKQVAWRICKDVRKTVVKCHDAELSVTVTIGIAAYKEAQSFQSMIEEADKNMYYGKSHGKNQVVTTADRSNTSTE
ncbi:MAG: diguanylate cyclase [Lachnospiraceae bacterium]|nr:diguanylate cyclase [Lachnospiraceae bacterium]